MRFQFEIPHEPNHRGPEAAGRPHQRAHIASSFQHHALRTILWAPAASAVFAVFLVEPRPASRPSTGSSHPIAVHAEPCPRANQSSQRLVYFTKSRRSRATWCIPSHQPSCKVNAMRLKHHIARSFYAWQILFYWLDHGQHVSWSNMVWSGAQYDCATMR